MKCSPHATLRQNQSAVMTKSLEQIQKENKKFILEVIHGCSYEEALEKELGFGCKVIDKMHLFFGEPSQVEMTLVYGNGVDDEESDALYFLHFRGNPCASFSKQEIRDKDRFEIIGKPLTLSRVLLALPIELYYYKNGNLLYIAKPNQDPKEQITWDLKKETLEEQSEETQRGINKFFND